MAVCTVYMQRCRRKKEAEAVVQAGAVSCSKRVAQSGQLRCEQQGKCRASSALLQGDSDYMHIVAVK